MHCKDILTNILLFVQEVLTILYSKLLNENGPDFLDTQYQKYEYNNNTVWPKKNCILPILA